MFSANSSVQAGYLTRDPELQTVVTKEDGEQISKCEFTIALNRYNSEQADFIQVVVWRKMAEDLVKYKKKGDPIYVEGRLENQSWTTKEGANRSRVVIKASHLQYMPSGRFYKERITSKAA